MAGHHNDAGDSAQKPPSDGAQPAHDHTSALHNDAYTPGIINYRHSPYETGKHEQAVCSTGPALKDLTIDTTIKEHETMHQGGTYAERKAETDRQLPVSNEHYRDIVKAGVDHLKGYDGYMSLQLRTAFDEAYKSDKSMHTGGKHVDDLIKYANANLCKNTHTLGRQGDNIIIYSKDDGDNHGKVTKYTIPLQLHNELK